jgi:methylated-DNA-protein-cysteine methyltransferase-like protein
MLQDTGFFQKVYDVVRQIPYGRVTSYGAIAEYLGSKGSARMVGWALNSSKYRLDGIPAHRVVNRQGLLTGKRAFGGQSTMQELLTSEGIHIEHDKIMDFKEVFWDPAREL